MLDWTGERFLPWRDDPALAYEHLHRYYYASQFVSGKTVLDLGSGEGYGSAILARTASKVTGVDISSDAVEHARNRYGYPNLEFLTGSMTAVPVPISHQFDLVTCFEAIEHIEKQHELLGEIARMLKPDGILIVSTPNKSAYDESIQAENEFHVKELEFDEFRSLLTEHFSNVRFLGQRIYAQSDFWPVEPTTERQHEFLIERRNSEFELTSGERRVPLYYIALASNRLSALPLAPGSLVDIGNELLKGKDRDIEELTASRSSQEESLQWLGLQLEERRRSIEWFESEAQSLRSIIAEQERQRERLGQDIEYQRRTIASKDETIASKDETIGSHEKALAWRAEQVEFLEREKVQLIGHVQHTAQKLDTVSSELEAIKASRSWQWILRVRRYRNMIRGVLGLK